MYLARMIAIPAALLWTTHAFQPPRRRLPRIGQRRLVAPEEASVAVQAYADKAASAIAAAVAGADASLLASTGFTLAPAGIVVAAAALGAAAAGDAKKRPRALSVRFPISDALRAVVGEGEGVEVAARDTEDAQVAQRLRSVDDQEDLVALGTLADLEPLRVAGDDGAVRELVVAL